MGDQSVRSVRSSLSSGALAGLASALALQPLDVIKTRLQEAGVGAPWRRRLAKVVASTYSVEGIAGFWRGTLPTVVRNVPGVAVYFVTLSQLQYLSFVAWRRDLPLARLLYDGETGRMSSGGNLTVGSAARTFAGMLLMPVTVLKVRFESTQYHYASLRDACRRIARTEGVRGFFRGFGATALRDAPHAGIYLFFYEGLKPLLRPQGGETTSTAGRLLAGATAGFLATATTQPFDLVKTRIQLAPENHRASFPQTLAKVVREEGALGLFRGMGPRVLRKSLSSALTWTIYEELVAWIRNSSPSNS